MTGNSVSVTRDNEGQVTFSDSFGQKEIHQLDAYGVMTVVRDENGTLLESTDELNEEETENESNLDVDPALDNHGKNLVENGDFNQGAYGWTTVLSTKGEVVDKVNDGQRNPV